MNFRPVPPSLPLLQKDFEFIVEEGKNQPALVEGLKESQILITGGTGFIGKWLIMSLIALNRAYGLGLKVVVGSRNPETFLEKHPYFSPSIWEELEFLSMDVCKPLTLPSFEQSVQVGDIPPCSRGRKAPNYVIHAATAASAQLNHSHPLLMLDTIIQGTRHVLEWSQSPGVRVDRMLLLSSGAVYGRMGDPRPFSEVHKGAPRVFESSASYGEGKRVAELLCGVFHRHDHLQVMVARCFAFVGPFLPLSEHFAVGNFILDRLMSRPIRIKGSGQACRSYLYAGEMALWLLHILLRGKPAYPYNVGSEKAHNMVDLAKTILSVKEESEGSSGSPPENPPIEILGQKMEGTQQDWYLPSTTRISEELGLTQKIMLEEAVSRTLTWYRLHKELW